jgi:hypothetical protein
MDKLERLFGHFGNLTPDEQRARIRQIRADRRLAKARPGAVKKAKKAAETTKAKGDARVKKLVQTADLDVLKRIMREKGYDC